MSSPRIFRLLLVIGLLSVAAAARADGPADEARFQFCERTGLVVSQGLLSCTRIPRLWHGMLHSATLHLRHALGAT